MTSETPAGSRRLPSAATFTRVSVEGTGFISTAMFTERFLAGSRRRETETAAPRRGRRPAHLPRAGADASRGVRRAQGPSRHHALLITAEASSAGTNCLPSSPVNAAQKRGVHSEETVNEPAFCSASRKLLYAS